MQGYFRLAVCNDLKRSMISILINKNDKCKVTDTHLFNNNLLMNFNYKIITKDLIWKYSETETLWVFD